MLFVPRRWRGALIDHTSTIRLEVLESDKRPVNAFADNLQVHRVQWVDINEDRKKPVYLLCDQNRSLEERLLAGAIYFVRGRLKYVKGIKAVFP